MLQNYTKVKRMKRSLCRCFLIFLLPFFISETGTTQVIPTGTNILNQDNFVGTFKDRQWFKDNIPFLEIPDADIQRVYYYRWWSYRLNLKYTDLTHGYIVTEFSQDVSWQVPYGGISCSAGHHFYEGRWLRNQRYMNDLADYWATGPGEPRSRDYSFWKADAYFARFLVNGNTAWIKKMYRPLIDNYHAWNRNYNESMGLYWREGIWDGMELAASSLQSSEPLWGIPGYRPTLNAYLHADALAIAKIADMQGFTGVSDEFKARAQNLKTNLHARVWDPSANFFKHKYRDEIPGNGNFPNDKYYPKESFVDAREVYGYVPWYTNTAEDSPAYIAAWDFLFDGVNGFYANYGPTTLERSHRLYRYQDQNCCRWNGMSWPFSTSQTLTAMANVLNNYRHHGILNKDRYVDILRKYALTQYKDGRPYVAEAHDPDLPVWTYDGANHSEHYNHSTFNDLIVSGLIGVRPRQDNVFEVNPLVPDIWDYFLLENVPYHGHLMTILYDKFGSRYGRGSGFKIYQDGNLLHSQGTIGKVLVPMAEPDISHNYGFSNMENYASNINRTGFPQPEASYTSVYDNLWDAIDGKIRFDFNPKSIWTSYGSPDSSDWYSLDFGSNKTINRIDLMFYDDNGGVKTPASYTLQSWDGNQWVDIPGQIRTPQQPVNDRNTIAFPPVSTQKIRVVMVHGGAAVGLTEIEVWQEIPVSLIGAGNGLHGTYFQGRDFTIPVLSRIDERIDFDWGSGAPDPVVPNDQFSVRWTGQIEPLFSELYTFHIRSDNGRRLWVDGQLIIDQWLDDWNVTYSGQIELEAGRKYDIRLEYFEEVGGANIQFSWESPSQFLEIVPQSQLYTTDIITGTAKETNDIALELYPNPAGTELKLEAEENITGIIILDISGRILKEEKGNVGKKKSFPVEDLPDGLYFVRIYTEGQEFCQKVMIKR